ncbi:ATP-grasp domain-containing protein [Kordiimonas pumila]|uniref:D-alanine--D-alanine ligase n=1 Tax=Kordiimonas pumila TaxID=2161677 RepID=A0ABV7D6S4_9PROT|nr:D-alanine--D-alanine ligase [Kordiimonas pumila]
MQPATDNALAVKHAMPLPEHAGMPALDDTAAETSWFEFAPAHFFYVPIALYCAWLSLRHLGPTLLTNANPALPYSGLVGESKFSVLNQLNGTARDYTAPYARFLRWPGDGGTDRTFREATSGMTATGLRYPVVAKPDIGMRGAGVQVIKNDTDLRHYISVFPSGANFLLQTLIDMEGEAGIFYVRHPEEPKGQIISLTLKYFPSVIGNGTNTLYELIRADKRAGKLSHLYLERHKSKLDTIVPDGEKVRLAFAGNHCRGTIFRNGNDFITDTMIDTFDKLAKSMGEFYIGRFDVRFNSFSELQNGTGFKIIEVNGAGGEVTHIWDSRMTLWGAYKALMGQFRHLYVIGNKNRKRGFLPTPLFSLFKAWRHEKKLTKHYPITH